jgi:hypothetical protein
MKSILCVLQGYIEKEIQVLAKKAILHQYFFGTKVNFNQTVSLNLQSITYFKLKGSALNIDFDYNPFFNQLKRLIVKFGSQIYTGEGSKSIYFYY